MVGVCSLHYRLRGGGGAIRFLIHFLVRCLERDAGPGRFPALDLQATVLRAYLLLAHPQHDDDPVAPNTTSQDL